MNTILKSYWKQFKKIVVIVVKLNHFNLLELAALGNRWVYTLLTLTDKFEKSKTSAKEILHNGYS